MKEHLKTNTTKMLHELGIPAHIKGYQYLRDTIATSVKDQETMNSVIKIPYPAIAKRNRTTASRVERAIRHVIEVVWGRGKVETIGGVSGYVINTGKDKPINSEFTALIPDKILLGYKKIQDKFIRKNFLISEKQGILSRKAYGTRSSGEGGFDEEDTICSFRNSAVY